MEFYFLPPPYEVMFSLYLPVHLGPFPPSGPRSFLGRGTPVSGFRSLPSLWLWVLSGGGASQSLTLGSLPGRVGYPNQVMVPPSQDQDGRGSGEYTCQVLGKGIPCPPILVLAGGRGYPSQVRVPPPYSLPTARTRKGGGEGYPNQVSGKGTPSLFPGQNTPWMDRICRGW